ncbi:MAG TPA: hypothetical protein VKR58_12680, partial [Aquella sp.]|nr:hypothetical protein [Aquella sp.]
TAITPIILSPQKLGVSWPIDLSPKNRYGQIPCVTVVKNPANEKLEALMYYVGGISDVSAKSRNLVRSASVALGSQGGILLNGVVQGNSGWQVDSSSIFLNDAIECGGALTNNSLAINLDLMSQWNQDLQPVYSLLRGEDKTVGQQSLPGHLRNANTLKSNLYFNAGTGIILDNSDPVNPTKLGILQNIAGKGEPILGMGASVSTKLISDSLQPDSFFKSGDSCSSQEEGKTVADQGISGVANNLLARSTLVCTRNDLLCGTENYCYLTSIPNQIIFRNAVKGIQNSSSQFICPKSVPFATNVQTGLLGGGQVYAIVNTGGTASPNAITARLDKNGIFTRVINCPTRGCDPGIRTDYKSGIVDGIGQLASVDLATITGNPVGTTSGGGNPNYEVIQGAIGNYTTPIGYTVDGSITACLQVCGGLKQVLGNSWQLLGMQRQSRIGANVDIDNSQLGCACERTDFAGTNPDNYKGIAVVILSVKSILVSVTCSNMPLFNKN